MKDPNKLKILAIIPSGFCFGLQHITVDFFSHFPPAVESHFLLTKWNNAELSTLLKKSNIPFSYSWLGMFSRKMDWHNIKMSFLSLVKLPKLYFDFLKLKRKIKPDILYFANHHELILLYPVLLFSKKKIVCHIHDPAPAIAFQKKTFKLYGGITNKFIAVSESVRLRTIDLGCPPLKIKTIHNGIILPSVDNAGRSNEFCKRAGWPETVFIIGITGQMTETKGHMDLLEAFRLVHAENSAVRLVIGGKEQEPFFSALKKRIHEYQLEPYVLFTGWLPDVSVFFQNINLFVLASRHEEGYGLVVAEAMACKLPVVITASGGAREIVEDGKNGFIVPKNDKNAMAEKITRLSVDPSECRLFGNNGRIRIEENFNIEKQSAALLECLKQSLNC